MSAPQSERNGAARDGRSASGVACRLCASGTTVLHARVTDRLYGTPGEWRMLRCCSPSCGLVQLDPVPDEATTALAYERYHTRFVRGADRPEPADGGGARRLLRGFNAWFLRVTGVAAEKRRVRSSYLGDVRPGRLLDVGCGNGKRLAELRDLGWEVMGQEVDARSAEVARRSFGIEVLVGPLSGVAASDGGFDAVVTNHVIEHVLQPVELLRESWRLVRPGGRLVCVTPNAAGIGHALFGARWRGLEAPRHLCVFTPRSIALAARSAGIPAFRCWTTAANTVDLALHSLAGPKTEPGKPIRAAQVRTRAIAALVQLLATLVHPMLPSSGDECVLLAER